MRVVVCSCKFDMWPLGKGAYMCRRCDTSPQGNMRSGPPNAPGTNGGTFVATWRDR